MKFLDLVKISRPFWYIFSILIAITVVKFTGSIFGLKEILMLVYLTFPYMLFAFGINDIGDLGRENKERKKEGWIMSGYILKKKDSSSLLKMILIINILFPAMFYFINKQTAIVLLILLLLNYFYSMKPLRFKERPFFDSISNGFILILMAMAVYSLNKDIFTFPFKLVLGGFSFAGAHAIATILDYKEDKKNKVNTLAVRYGCRTASVFAFIVFLSLLFIFGIVSLITKIAIIYLIFLSFILALKPTPENAKKLTHYMAIGMIVLIVIWILK